MKTIALAALTALTLAGIPAHAQTMPLVIETSYGDMTSVSAPLTMQDRIEIAAEDACEKPFLRDLKGQELYATCLAEARAEAEAIVAERATSEPTELALR